MLAVFWIGSPAQASDFQNDFEVEIDRYLGLWYEIARTPNDFQDNTPKRDGERLGACKNTTAAYTLLEPGRIGVRNTCQRDGEDGGTYEEVANGIARLQDGTQGRKLKVAFGPWIARFFQRLFTGGGSGYWIYCLGPVNADEVYDWAVISGSDRDYIFVVARDRDVAPESLESILTCARNERLPVDQLIYRQE